MSRETILQLVQPRMSPKKGKYSWSPILTVNTKEYLPCYTKKEIDCSKQHGYNKDELSGLLHLPWGIHWKVIKAYMTLSFWRDNSLSFTSNITQRLTKALVTIFVEISILIKVQRTNQTLKRTICLKNYLRKSIIFGNNFFPLPH